MLHALGGVGAPSETFLIDRMVELERLGWEGWVGARWLEEEAGGLAFPLRERLFLARRRDLWIGRLEVLLRRRPRAELGGWWLEPAVRASRPALIHAHFGWTGTWALPAARRHRLPLVVGFHGYDALVYPRYGFGAQDEAPQDELAPGVYRELFAEAARILVTSRYLAGELRRLGCERELDVIPSGIDLDRFPFRGPRDHPTEYRVVFIGRLIPYKGLDVALRALSAVGAAVPNVRLDVIGDGPQRRPAESLASELDLPVRFHGSRPHDAVAELLTRSDVLVLPSRTTEAGHAEALGNVAKEALAVGLPVAASNSGGIPETVPPEFRDELVPENDHGALAARLIALWQSRDSWAQRTERGRRWVERTFDWEILAPRIGAVYEEALGQLRQ